MCLDTVKWAANFKTVKAHKQEGNKGVIRYKLLKKYGSEYSGPYYGWAYEKHAVYKAMTPKLDDYYSGFHVFKTEEAVKKYGSEGNGSVVKVLCWGLLAQGTQDDIPCEVYKYMMIL